MKRKVLLKQKGLWASICLFAVILLVFGLGVGNLSAGTKARQRDTLERALNQIIAYCYASEGEYPQSLEYMKETYGLTYDEDLFYVDYQVTGANIYPDVTILEQS